MIINTLNHTELIHIICAEILGFKTGSHPRNLVLSGILVIPPCSRPPALMTNGQTKSSDLTDMYKSIVEINNNISSTDTSNLHNLAVAVNNLMVKGVEDSSKERTGSLKMKMTDKMNGIIRGMTHGKTITNSGRGVITGDPTLKFGEIGIPKLIAERLNVNVTVTEENVDELQQMLRDGYIFNLYPEYEDYRIVSTNIAEKYVLSPGMSVDRQMRDGDYVLSFRQPVLHKLSMLANKVRIKQDNDFTFSIHMAETTARNADFDGDEINGHCPKTESAMNQIIDYITPRTNMMDSQNNIIAMSVVYDGLIAIFLLMEHDELFSPEQFFRYISKITNTVDLMTLGERCERLGVELYSKQALFSALLPATLYYRKNDVVIADGILVDGFISKNQVGTATDTIIQEILMTYGVQRSADFITDIYFVLIAYLSDVGFSVGYKDLIKPDSINEEIQSQLLAAIEMVKVMDANVTDPVKRQFLEQRIQDALGNTTEKLYKLNRDEQDEGNRFVELIVSGAKGKDPELGGMTAFVGQKFTQGQRLKLSITDGTRCLPYFKPDDHDPRARGFCTSSYLTGLSPAEFLFGATGARDDIVVMMLGTPDTGSLNHHMIRSLENIKIEIDGTVRSTGGHIIQYMYGNDGMEAERMITQKTNNFHTNTFINLRRTVDRLNTQYGIIDRTPIGEREEDEFVQDDIDIDMEIVGDFD